MAEVINPTVFCKYLPMQGLIILSNISCIYPLILDNNQQRQATLDADEERYKPFDGGCRIEFISCDLEYMDDLTRLAGLTLGLVYTGGYLDAMT